jgi:hypothetical protein
LKQYQQKLNAPYKTFEHDSLRCTHKYTQSGFHSSQALPGDAIQEAEPLGVTGGKASRRAFPARDWEWGGKSTESLKPLQIGLVCTLKPYQGEGLFCVALISCEVLYLIPFLHLQIYINHPLDGW